MRKILFYLALAGTFAVYHDAARVEKISQSDDERKDNALESLADTEKWLKKIVNSGVKVALPFLMTTATEVNLNGQCMRGLLKLMSGVMNIRDWAIRMVDALGKPSAGILEGTATAMGDYDECIEIAVPKNSRSHPKPPYSPEDLDFTGQYCVIQVQFPEGIKKAAMDYQKGNRSTSELANTKTFLRNFIKIAPRADIADLRFGVCIPSTCSKDDLQALVGEISRIIMFKATTMRCEVKEGRKFSAEQIAILTVTGTILILVITGTVVELYFRFKRDKKVDDIKMEQSALVQSILAFSAPSNMRKLLSIKSDSTDKIRCIRGLKFMSICLYIVVWTYANNHDYHFLKYRSAFHFLRFMEQWWFTIFANASAGVDTLFFVAGLQVTYRLWKKFPSGKVQVNIPKLILKWFSRFAMLQIMAIALLMCLPLIGSGPMWADIVTPIINNCKERWWLNILALNNFWPSTVTCFSHTWLLCAVMHLLLMAPIILFILSKWTSVGVFVNVILILGSSVAIAMITLMNDLPPAPAFYFLSFINLRTIWEKLFIQAYDHVGPFCLGMMMGYFFHRYPEIKLRRLTVFIGWFTAVFCDLTVLCGLYGYRHGETMELTLSAIYASVHRLAWSLGIAWITFACAYGYGGFVDRILSSKLLIPLDRITILVYVLHPLVKILHEGQLREKIYMGHFDQAMYATAYIVFTVILSGICFIFFVSPYTYFEKKIWNHFDDAPAEEICQEKPKRKDSKPAVIEIGLPFEKPKLHKSKLEKLQEIQSHSHQT